MQGNLNEIDICSILKLIELGQRTGQLWVKTHTAHQSHKLSEGETDKNRQRGESKPQSWFIFFLNGQIVYCQAGDSSLARIDDYLRRYRVKPRVESQQLACRAVTNFPEYTYIWALLQQNIITPKIARTIIYGLVQEALFDLLSLHQGSFIFERGTALAPQLTSLEIAPLIAKITKQVQEWKQLYPHIQSTEQLLILSNKTKLTTSLSEDTVKKLHKWADGKTSLRQLARYLNRDTLTLAKAIYPYVQQGWLELVYSEIDRFGQEKQTMAVKKYKRRIVCIEDTLVICETIESILALQGYETISITNPLQALSLVFELQPDLILCKMMMAELDGYELCTMLRHSTIFQTVPIIILTSKDEFMDRIRARMAGANDYLTKPFTDQELLIIVEQYLNLDGCPVIQRYKTC